MKPNETGVLKKSDLLFHTPSSTAKKIYFYPISAGHFFAEKGYHLIRKNYKSLLVTHIIDGSFTYVLNGKHITARKNDTVILDCFKPHEYYTDDRFESIWIHFNGPNILEIYEEITALHGNLIKSNDYEHIKILLFRIFNNISEKEHISEVNMSLDIYKLIADLSNSASTINHSKANYDDCVLEAKKYINEHLNEKLTVQTISEIAHISPSHFSRVFKQKTGFSPYDYVLITRLNRAKEYLKKTDLSVSQIAYEVGFNSDTNFIFFFKTNTGMSPNKFRKLKF